jgi:hypothetical protein
MYMSTRVGVRTGPYKSTSHSLESLLKDVDLHGPRPKFL